MRKATFFSVCRSAGILLFIVLFTQIGLTQNVVNGSSPDPKSSVPAKIANKDKSQAPRIALTGIHDSTSVKGNPTNFLIYNTVNAGLKPNDVSPGYYHNVGTTKKPVWERIEILVKDAINKKEDFK